MAELTGWFVAACWLCFLAYWLYSAQRVKAVKSGESFAQTLAHRALLAPCYVLLAVRALPWPFELRVFPALHVAGALVCALGLAIAITARRKLAGNWSSAVTLKQDHELIRTGIYRFVRHPIYSGILTMCAGSALESGQLRTVIAFALMLAAFLIKVHREERVLSQHFADYADYKRTTKALIPFVI